MSRSLRRNRGLIVVILAAACMGCLRPEASVCDSGILCPSGSVCRGASCVPREQLCAGQGECTFAGIDGTCIDGVCAVTRCGNGQVEAPEQCEPDVVAPRCVDLEPPLDFFYSTERTGCTAQCTFDLTECFNGGYCGDGAWDDDDGELCDDAIAPGQAGSRPPLGSCVAFGFNAGRLGCSTTCEPDPSACVHFGLTQLPTATTRELRDIDAMGPGWAVIVGDDGTLAHSRDGVWEQSFWPDTDDFNAVWAAPGGDAYAVGRTLGAVDNATIVRWHDGQWQQMSVPPVDELLHVTGLGDSEVYAANAYGLLRFDGTSWSELSGPDIAPSVSVIDLEPDPDGRLAVLFATGALWLFDGVDWTEGAAAPADVTVLRLGGDELFAWGTSLYRLVEGSWQQIDGLEGAPSAVWISPQGRVMVPIGSPMSLFYDSGAWIPVETGLVFNPSFKSGVWADDIWGLSPGGRLFRGGQQWIGAQVPPGISPTGIAAGGDGRMWAVGDAGAIWKYDSGSWTLEDSPTSNPLNDVYFSAPDNGVAVGRSASVTGNGIVVRYDGDSWTIDASIGVVPLLHGVWAQGAVTVAVGDAGTVRYFDGTTWQDIDVDTTMNLNAVWGRDADDLYAAGGGVPAGAIFHYDGSSWTEVVAAVAPLWDVHGQGELVAAVGNESIWIFDGNEWREDLISGTQLQAVHVNRPDDIFVLAVGGLLYHYDGFDWDPVRLGSTDSGGKAVWASDEVVAVAQNVDPRTVLLYRFEPWH